MKHMNIIAIDCGASYIKGAKIVNGIIIERRQEVSPKICRDEELLKPKQIYKLINLVDSMIQKLVRGEKEVKLCISNEMHGFLLTDINGTPYTDYISWQNELGSDELSILKQEKFNKLIQKTGMSLRAGLPSCNLFHLCNHNYINDCFPIYFYTLGDFLIRKFTDKQPVCHPTNAAATGLYDINKEEWNKELINQIGSSKIVYPEIGERIITICKYKVLFHVFPAIGDYQAALLGAGIQENMISINLGTGAQVSVLSKAMKLSKEYQICPYFYSNYLYRIAHLPSGRAINVYYRFFKEFLFLLNIEVSDEKLWELLLKEAENSKNTKLLFDMSFFENPITHNTVGSIQNISEYGFTVGNVIRGALNQMINDYMWAINKICPNVDNIDTILFSGGLANKISIIREELINNMPNVSNIILAKDETILGLYKYGERIEIS